MAPKVSILIPVYNVSKFLPRCLDSCINQTLKDIEVVCVNDGSTDESLSVLEKYAKQDKRIVIVNKENGGLPSARNAGMNNAKGEYVFFLDGDDYIDTKACEILYKKAKEENSSVVIFGAQIVPESKNTPWFENTLVPQEKKYSILKIKQFLSEPFMFPFLWRDFVLRSRIEDNSFRLDEEIIIGEDTAFQFKILPLATNVVSIRDKLYFYDLSRDNSLTNNKKYKDIYNRIHFHLLLVEKLHDEWKSRNIYDEEAAPYFLRWALEFFYWDFCSVFTNQKIEVADSLVDLLKNCEVETYLEELPNYYQNFYSTILNWSKKEPIDLSSKKITLYLPIYNGLSVEEIETLLKQFENYSESINFIGLTDYNDPNRFMDIEKLHDSYSFFFLRREDEECNALSNAITFCPTDYFEILTPGVVLLSDYNSVLEKLNGCDMVIASNEQANLKYSITQINVSNIIFRKNFLKESNIEIKEFDCYTTSSLKLESILKSKNTVSIQKLFIGDENTSNYADDLKVKIRQLDYIIYLLEMSKETGDDNYKIMASEIVNRVQFVRHIVSLPFGWSEENIPLVKEVLKRILIISNSHQICTIKSVDKMLIEFIRNAHTHMANIIKLIIK